MDIGPGDFVECVIANAGWDGLAPTIPGKVYFVSAVVDTPSVAKCWSCGYSGRGILRPQDIPSAQAWAWCPCTFRPFQGPETEKQQFKLKEPA